MPEVNAPLGAIVTHTFGVDAMDTSKQAHSRRRPVASPGAGQISLRIHLLKRLAWEIIRLLRRFLRHTSQAR